MNYQVKEDEMARECSMHRENMNAYRILVGKPEGKRSLGRHRRRQEDNITMGLSDIKWGGRERIDLAQYRDKLRALVNKVMNIRVP
jgi:hypothetical protein